MDTSTLPYSFADIIKKIKNILKKSNTDAVLDKEVAEALQLKADHFATLKKRGRVPYPEVLEFCYRRNISIYWMMYGTGPVKVEKVRNTYTKLYYRERAKAWEKALKEEASQKDRRDGIGYRFRVGACYAIAGDTKKAMAAYNWAKKFAPYDTAEPISELYWAITEYRAGNIDKATHRLQRTMLSNYYLIPLLIGNPIEHLRIWHHTNQHNREYLDLEEEYLYHLSVEELKWIEELYYSDSFERLRGHTYRLYTFLLKVHDPMERRKFISEYNDFINAHKEEYPLIAKGL